MYISKLDSTLSGNWFPPGLTGVQAGAGQFPDVRASRKRKRRRHASTVDITFDEDLAKQIFDDDETKYCCTLSLCLNTLS